MVVGPFQSRAWQSRDDTRLMQALVRDRLTRDWPSANFHPGDLDWWAVLAFDRLPSLIERVRLWTDMDGRLVGYAWLRPPADVDFLVGAGLNPDTTQNLIIEMLAWADSQRSSAGGPDTEPLVAWVAAEDRTAMGAVVAAGMTPERRPGMVIFTGDLSVCDSCPAPAVPVPMRVQHLETDADIAARVECGRAAFPDSTMTADRYRRVHEAWLYRSDLDLQVVTPEGQAVAFALGWLDPATRTVELEPVGVHPDWQGRGLGGEICRAVLRSARELGATRAMIAAERSNDASLALYSSLGLQITSEIVAFTTARAPLTSTSA